MGVARVHLLPRPVAKVLMRPIAERAAAMPQVRAEKAATERMPLSPPIRIMVVVGTERLLNL